MHRWTKRVTVGLLIASLFLGLIPIWIQRRRAAATWSIDETIQRTCGFWTLKGKAYREFLKEFRRRGNPEATRVLMHAMSRHGVRSLTAVQAFGQLATTEFEVEYLEHYIMSSKVDMLRDHDYAQIVFTQIGYMAERNVPGASELFLKLKSPAYWRKHGVSGRGSRDQLKRENRLVHDLLIGYAWSKSPTFPVEARQILEEIDDPEQKKTMEWLIDSCIEYHKNIVKQAAAMEDGL